MAKPKAKNNPQPKPIVLSETQIEELRWNQYKYYKNVLNFTKKQAEAAALCYVRIIKLMSEQTVPLQQKTA